MYKYKNRINLSHNFYIYSDEKTAFAVSVITWYR